MLAKEIREKYLEFFKGKGHSIIPSASLVPENDPTVLFTTAGMHPLVPYLLGEKHPAGQRLVNFQKCVRTNDIEEVGDATHHSFFEMLGNWSLGDSNASDGIGAGYFKKEALEWSWEFLTSPEWLGLDPKRIAVSVFAGDTDAPFDEESFQIWRALGLPVEKIAKLGKKENWWGPAGETGPCGPDSEIFYWAGAADKIPDAFNDDNELWVEIWNNVFMEYFKQADGSFVKLTQKNVDTGMGLERITSATQGLDGDYQTELWKNIVAKIEELSGKKYADPDFKKAMRIVADHLKATTFILGGDKSVAPSNTDQGYIVRRLIRRAIRYGKQLGIEKEFWTAEIAKITISDYAEIYPELKRNADFIVEQLKKEEEQFSKTLEKGLKMFDRLISNFTSSDKTARLEISGKDFFDLFQTYGFPFEMVIEEIKNRGFLVDEEGMFNSFCEEKKKEFEEEMKKHQELSRTASAGKFKGGLADASEETTKLHTVAHLLLAGLRKVLGGSVEQKGSNITADRLRFDFSYSEKMTDAQKQEVEKLVNDAIQKKLPVLCEEMSLQEAKDKGATGSFNSKYGERVKVYKIADGAEVFSYEICGGPHIENIGTLGKFKIKKEESSSAGVRRIKAVLV